MFISPDRIKYFLTINQLFLSVCIIANLIFPIGNRSSSSQSLWFFDKKFLELSLRFSVHGMKHR